MRTHTQAHIQISMYTVQLNFCLAVVIGKAMYIGSDMEDLHWCIHCVHTSTILQSSPSLYITLDQLSNYVTYIHMPAIHRLEELLVL